MDTGDLNLPAYKYQLEQVNISFIRLFRIFNIDFFQVEVALKATPEDPELLKLKQDLEVNIFLVIAFL